MSLPVPVFDLHAHLPYDGGELWGPWGRAYARRFGEDRLARLVQRNHALQRDWWRGFGFPEPEAPQPDPAEAARRFAAEAERYGLLGINFVTGGGNARLAAAIRAYPRLFGFAHHDPFDPEAPALLERAVHEEGLVGLKIFAPAHAIPLNDPRLDPLWATAERLGVPVLVHFGPLGGAGGVVAGPNISPLVLHDVAKGFPDLKFIVPHFGCGYTRELMHLMWAAENVFVDTSGNNEWRRYQWPVPTLKDLFRAFLEAFGPERILFGSDSSHFPRGWVKAYFDEQFRALWELGVSEAAMARIFAENALDLLPVSLDL